MFVSTIVFFFLTLFVSESLANTLRVIEAGRNGKAGPTLPALSFCPSSFSSKGFSIVCVPSTAGVRQVVFKVNGRVVKRESVAPYAINGDIGDLIVPYSKYSDGTNGVINISCEDNKGGSVTAQFSADCSSPDTKAHSRSLPPPPRKQAPPPSPPQSPPKPAPAPSSAQRTTSNDPVGVDRKYCVTRKASQYIGGKHSDWTSAPNGALVYKKDDMSHDVDSSRRATLRYEFSVPVESTYGIVVEMTTKHPTEHNDVWLSCGTGATLRKPGGSIIHKGPDDPFKVYHNENGRSKKSLTVDFDAHSISTKIVLKPNTKYTCTVGGRSSRTTVHGLILFPCHENTCTYASPHWKQYLGLCHI